MHRAFSNLGLCENFSLKYFTACLGFLGNPRTCALTACNIPCMPVLLQHAMHLLCSSVFELSIRNFLARPPLPVCSPGFAAIELLLPVAPLLLSFRCTPRVFCALLSSLFSFACASCVELLLSSAFAALSGHPSSCLALSVPRRALC